MLCTSPLNVCFSTISASLIIQCRLTAFAFFQSELLSLVSLQEMTRVCETKWGVCLTPIVLRGSRELLRKRVLYKPWIIRDNVSSLNHSFNLAFSSVICQSTSTCTELKVCKRWLCNSFKLPSWTSLIGLLRKNDLTKPKVVCWS